MTRFLVLVQYCCYIPLKVMSPLWAHLGRKGRRDCVLIIYVISTYRYRMYVHINNTSLHPSLLFFCLMKSLYPVGGEFAPHLKLVPTTGFPKPPLQEKLRRSGP